MRREETSGEAARGREIAGIAGLVILHLALFWRAVLRGGVLAHSDICYFFEPAKSFMHDALRAGRLPLWSPHIYCGYPMAAEGQVAAFYPPSVILAWLLPSPAAVTWLVISHLALAAVAMYALARAIGLRPFPAWLAGLVFSFSGYLFAHSHHVSLVCAAAWLPVVLLCIERAGRGRTLPWAVAGAAAWGASALCGHPQTVFQISLAAGFWIILRARQARRAGEPSPWRRAITVAATVFILGFALASVQLLMTAELSRLAPHGERGSLEYVTSFSLLPRHLIGLVAPNWQGTVADNTYRGERYYWEYVLYLGIVPLVLAAVGATSRRGWVWAGVAISALVLALAQGNPLYHLLRFLPGFADFRAPARYVFLFSFAGAILAGQGWERVAGWRLLARGRRLLVVGAAVALLSVANLLAFARTLAPLASPEVFAAEPRVVQTLAQDPAWGRAFVLPPIQIYADWSPPGGWAGNPDGWLEARVYLPASVPQSFGLHVVGGYAGFVDPRHARFFDEASHWAAQRGDLSLYSLVGTRHFVLPPQIALPGLPWTDAPPFRVHLNAEAFPRAFAVAEVVPAGDDEEALGRTLDLARAGRLRSAAVVRGGVPELPPGAAPAEVTEVQEPRPERISAQVRSEGGALVVLNERWAPGWRASVDGRPVPLYEMNALLMGAPVPAGEHVVEFTYRPTGFIVGRIVTGLALAACVALLAISGWKRRESAPQSSAG